MSEHKFLIHETGDDVGVAVQPISKGEEVVGVDLKTKERIQITSNNDIPMGHKIALVGKEKGSSLTKYGEDVKNAVEETVKTYGKLDIAVASAGIGGDNATVIECTKANWDKVNAVDYTGVMLTDKYAIEQMRKQGHGGAVINLASMFGLVAVPTNIAYSASKGGVVNLTKAAGTNLLS